MELDSGRDQENGIGTKRVQLGKRANNSRSPSKEKRRSESPLRIESTAGMFSEVQDNITANITIVEETADEEGDETYAERMDASNKDQERMDFTTVDHDLTADEYVMADTRTVIEGNHEATLRAVEDVEVELRKWLRKGNQKEPSLEEDSDEDSVGYEESGEDIHNTSSSEKEDNLEEGGDESDKSGRDGRAPEGANL